MDDADRASENEDRRLAMLLARRTSVHVQATDECAECGLEISSARQIATGGTDVCAKCKEDAELKQKLQA